MASPTDTFGSPGGIPYPHPNGADTKKSLQEILETLRRGKWLILGILLIALIAAAVYTVLADPEYESSALLMVDTQSAGPPDDMMAFIGGGLESRNLANQLLILEQSLLIAENAAERVAQMEVVPETGEPFTLLKEEDESTSIRELALRLQEEYVYVSMESEDVDAIWIKATSTIPAEAALIANIYAEEYVQRTKEINRKQVTASREFLEDQIEKRKSDLDGLENEVKEYMSREGAVALDEASASFIAQIALLEASLDEARIQRSMREASLNSLERELEGIMPNLANRLASGVQEELTQARLAVAELQRRREEIYIRNPALRDDSSGGGKLQNDVQELNARIAQMRERIQTLSQQYAKEALSVGGDAADPSSALSYANQIKLQITQEQNELSQVRARESALEQRLAEYDEKLKNIPEQSIELAQLERARQASEQLNIRLIEQLQEAVLAEEAEVGYAEIIRPALVPEEPVGSGAAQNLIVGALLGLILGIGAALARQRLDTRIYTPDDLQERRMNLLGTVPDMRPMIENQFGKESKVALGEREVSATLAPLLNPFSPTSEAYRRLYTSLQFSTPDKVIQTVLITSAEAGVGKSTTAINLATTAAKAGRRTLIIDADLRRPALYDYLGLRPSVGLETLLRGRGAADLEMERFATDIDNIYVIAAREPADSPAELLGSRDMRMLVERLRELFDIIVFDSPPVLAATDATLLSTQCDATILVVGSGATDADALEQVVDELKSVGANVAGVMLNRFDATHTYGYKHTYGYRQQSYYGHLEKQ